MLPDTYKNGLWRATLYTNVIGILNRKEVIQPHVPVRLPCYDLALIMKFTVIPINRDFGRPTLSALDGRCVQDPGTYSRHRC